MVNIHYEHGPLDTTTYERLIERHEPVVFRGLANAWLPASAAGGPAVLNWLKEQIGHRMVPVSVGLPCDGGFVGDAGFVGTRSMGTTLNGTRRFSDIAREMEREITSPSGHVLYVHSLPVADAAPELANALGLADGDWPADGHWRAWIGTGSHHGYLHIDETENFFALLAGTKRFLLCPFDVLPDAYVGPLEGGAYSALGSMVNPRDPDLTTFPRFKNLLERSVTVTLEAGDVLYLPSGWWHSVGSEGFNVAVNYWWFSVEAAARADAALMLKRALLSLRPLPKYMRSYWKEMFEHFVFRLEGDPYEHLPAQFQGFAGQPTTERIMALHAHLIEAARRRENAPAA